MAQQLGCVLMTPDYMIVLPNEEEVMRAVQSSTAKRFVDDPVSTLQALNRKKIENLAEYLLEQIETPDKGKKEENKK